MPSPIATVDTNVLLSALRSSLGASFRLIQLVDEGALVMGLTTPLVCEYEEICKREIDATPLTTTGVDRLIDALCLIGKRCTVYYRARPSLIDPDDEMVLEAAIASGSAWIITHNIRDFASVASQYGIEAITPAEALRRLGVGK